MLKNTNTSSIINILAENELDLTKFWEVYNIIKINNYDSKGIKEDDLVDSAIK
ncbi:hypothetical protein ACFLY2_03540 [Patescibacteria group bacterium]